MPSPAAWSFAVPSSTSGIVHPPGVTVTLSAPFGFAQSMLSIASLIGWLTVAETNDEAGCRRDVTTEFEQVNALYAFSRLLVTVLASDGIVSPEARIRFLIALQSRDGSAAFSRAAPPLTCGVAIDVPLNVL